MTKNYSNLALSKALADMKLESDKVHVDNSEEIKGVGINEDFILIEKGELPDYANYIPAPHLLDLITIYAKQVFGEEIICSNCKKAKHTGTNFVGYTECCNSWMQGLIIQYKHHSQQILSMLQEEKSNDFICDYVINNLK